MVLIRRLLGAFAATSVVLVSLLVSVVAAGGGVAAAGPTGAGTTLAATDLMIAQVPLVAAADKVKAAGSFPGSGYSNITLSVPNHLVTVYWKGTLPAVVQTVVQSLRSANLTIDVQPAAYSKAELDQQVAKLMAARVSLAASGIRLDEIGARIDGSGIDVGLTAAPRTPAAAISMPSAASLVGAGLTVPVQVSAARTLTTMHRLEDFPAHWSGSRIITVQGNESCTTGFPMQRYSDGRTFITTAAHCDSSLGHPVNEQWWDYLGPHDSNGCNFGGGTISCHRMGEAWYHALGLDVAYIRPPAGAVSGWNYDGGVAEAHDFQKPVAGYSSNYLGLYVCTSGAWSGVHCAIKVNQFMNTWVPEDNSWVPLWYANQTANCANPTSDVHKCFASATGDSGGPVFVLTPDRPGTVEGVGSITGATTGLAYCTNDNGESNFQGTLLQCATDVAYVDEASILTWLNAFILTN